MAVITAEQAGGAALVRMLDTIAYSEGTSTSPHTKNDGYNIIVSGVDGHHEFTDYSDHPLVGKPGIVIRREPLLVSSAAGRYQLLAKYWPHYKEVLHLPDFSPLSQDRVALQQIKECRATQNILEGNIEVAIAKLRNIWASFPGNGYGQGGKSMAALVERFRTEAVA